MSKDGRSRNWQPRARTVAAYAVVGAVLATTVRVLGSGLDLASILFAPLGAATGAVLGVFLSRARESD